jgi:hypothetical protein
MKTASSLKLVRAHRGQWRCENPGAARIQLAPRSATVLSVVLLAASLILGSTAAHAAGTAVEQWGIFELTLKGPAEGNPYVDVRLSATFTNGAITREVAGFYDGGDVYRIRFMPEAPGTWRYETKSNSWPLTGQLGSFTASPAKGANHGLVRVHNTFHFAYADGTPFKQVGTTIYNWLDTPEQVQEQTLKTLASAPFNKVRMLILPQTDPYRKKIPPARWPFAGQPPRQWDFTKFNPDYFRHYEQRLGQLRDLGIEADLILFNPYGKPWGFDTMDAAADERYIRYVIARFGAYRNVWWSIANEFDFLRTKTMKEWDRYFEIVQEADPYGHLRSIHNGTLIYDHNKPWVTHVSMQNGAAVEESGRAQMYRDVYQKPVVYDEVKYEGDSAYRWGNLNGREMVHRFWSGTVAGTYVGHGDYFFTDETDTWTSFGGALRGESAPRLKFLREVLEESPAEGIDPIDKWQDPNTAGKPGDYYLIYLGRATPTSWPFQLYKNGVTEGLRFKVELLDTWEMKVTAIEGEFVTKKKDNYHFVDTNNRSVPLPGKPGMALRIRRLGSDGTPVNTELAVE